MALSFGLASIAEEFTPLFFGEGFEPCALLIVMFAPIFIVKSYSTFVRMNLLIPFNRDRQYTIAVIVGAIVNLIANACFIPKYGAIGAVLGTMLAETSVCIIQLYHLPIYIEVKEIVSSVVPYLIISANMFISVRLTANIEGPLLFRVLCEITVGIFSFVILCVLYWTINKNNVFLSIVLFGRKRK